MPSYIVAAFLSLDFCQTDLSSLLGPTVFVINHLAFQQHPYLQGFSQALLKVTEGQSEPLVPNTKSQNVKTTGFTISICKKIKLTRKFFNQIYM